MAFLEKLWRNLENQLAPNSGKRLNVVILENVNVFVFTLFTLFTLNSLMNLFDLFQARSEIRLLEEQAKLLEENYEAFKQIREILLTQREKTFHGIIKIFFYSII